MNCFYHSDREAKNFCNGCGKPLCADCSREVKERIYCEDCLFKAIVDEERLKNIDKNSNTKVFSVIFAIILPGLGSVYNGEYLKGFFHLTIFATLIYLTTVTGLVLFPLLAVMYYFYTIFDAYKDASLKLEKGEKKYVGKYGGIVRGLLLIFLGLIFLLNNFNLLNLDFMKTYWPVLLIIFGVYIIYSEYIKKENLKGDEKDE